MNDDLIRRQDAINELQKEWNGAMVAGITWDEILSDSEDAIYRVPSAQPLVRTEMSSADLISRQAGRMKAYTASDRNGDSGYSIVVFAETPEQALTSDDWMGEVTQSKLSFKTDTTTEWLGNHTPFRCKRCGHYSDNRTPYCAYCGKKATNVANS